MNRNMHEYRRIFLYFEDAWVKSKDKKQRFNNFFNDECETDPNLQILFTGVQIVVYSRMLYMKST